MKYAKKCRPSFRIVDHATTIGVLLAAVILLLLTACTTEVDKEKETAHRQEITAMRAAKDRQFQNQAGSPLPPEQIADFTGLNYFPINYGYRLVARFEKITTPESFRIKTSTTEERLYTRTGRLKFKLKGAEYQLMTYEDAATYRDQRPARLFVPFTDETTGRESYGGGRYLDIEMSGSGGDTVILDFNLAYNPYCAYSQRYSCPIPPPENHLKVKILAGEKTSRKESTH